ncbi:Uncharacterised protein [Mycobacteroides abscessus subsp. massiliense]|nr:Uncharacterised protein [Mycobacteroides abscessus subsp. massiliense]
MTATGAEYADEGGASRFFPVFRYEAKAPTSERPNADGVQQLEDRQCIAIEREADYLPLIVSRLQKPMQQGLFGLEAGA